MSRLRPIYKVDILENMPTGTSVTHEKFVLHFVNTFYGGNLKIYNLTYEVNVINIFTGKSTKEKW